MFPTRALFVRCQTCGHTRFMDSGVTVGRSSHSLLERLRCTQCGARSASVGYRTTREPLPPPATVPKKKPQR